MAYNQFKVYGNSDVNYIYCTTGEATLPTDPLVAPVWDDNTVMLANFRENTYASSFGESDTITGYRVQRYEVEYDKVYEVVDVTADDLFVQDYNIRNNRTYKYIVTPKYKSNDTEVEGVPIVSEDKKTAFNGWTIIGAKPTDVQDQYIANPNSVWTFRCNIEPEPFHPMYNHNYHTGFRQFPKVVNGQENYLEGGLKCLIGDVDCRGDREYGRDTIDVIERWRAFCANDEIKLLKDFKGHIIPCSIKDTTYTLEAGNAEELTTISFSFVQIADRDSISIYGLEG